MLRLAPTSIPLTRGEIAQYELRSEERRRNQPLSSSRRQASTSYANSSIRSAQPHVRAGPWRSVIYHDGTKPRSLSAEGDGPGTDYSDSVCSNPSYGHDTTVSANGHVSGSDGSAKSVMSRRDSVLSSDHDPQHQQLSLPASKEIVNNTDLSPNLDGSRDELDFDTTEALLGLRLANDRRKRSCSGKYYGRRVSHGRSLSDPSEVGTPHHGLEDSHSSRTSQAKTTTMVGCSSAGMGQCSDPINELGSGETNHYGIRRKLVPSKHNRHHSMPNPLHQSPPKMSPHSTRLEIDRAQEHEKGSAISECLRNSSSPLDQLVESAAALRMSSPHMTAALSHRSKDVVARRIRFPSFGDDDDSPVLNGLRGGAAEEGVEHSSDHKKDVSTSNFQSRQAAPSTASVQPRLRRVLPLTAYAEGPSWAPGRSMGVEFSLSQEAVPAQIERRQPTRPAIRRRPLPNVNQENEDEMAPLYAEREAWIARQLAPPQGRLEATPSPEGRLERLMR